MVITTILHSSKVTSIKLNLVYILVLAIELYIIFSCYSFIPIIGATDGILITYCTRQTALVTIMETSDGVLN